MAETTISWTDYTFNPWIGCTKIEPRNPDGTLGRSACTHCYAEKQSKRNGLWANSWGRAGERVATTSTDGNPLMWNRRAISEGRRLRVFSGSLCDICDPHPSIRPEWRERLWSAIRATPHLDWLLLTKRPRLLSTLLPEDLRGVPNVWLGTTVENQQWADYRIPALLDVPAAVHFLSCEPLLGPLDLSQYLAPSKINWVIVGGETGGKEVAQLDVNWVRTIRDQCQSKAGFYFKQWGCYRPEGRDYRYFSQAKDAGCTLDGREWLETPKQPEPNQGRGRGRPKVHADAKERGRAFRERHGGGAWREEISAILEQTPVDMRAKVAESAREAAVKMADRVKGNT